MTTIFNGKLLPQSQRRTLDELAEDLDLGRGDVDAKRSAFWTMLLLSAVIASAGVIADSTATVIGAMIVAPLSVPIMGMALGVVMGSPVLLRRSALVVTGGVALVIAVGVVASVAIPDSVDLLENTQIAGRTSPSLVDLVAAMATGLAGAVGLARRDVAAVLPGVAIAISLVPPLAVVGVCAGEGQWSLAIGALLLFASNLVALVLAGTLTFTAYGYAREAREAAPSGAEFSRRRAYVGIVAGLLLVLLPLAANTVGNILVTVWTARIHSAAEAWLSDSSGASIDDVVIHSNTVYITVRSPDPLPAEGELLAALKGEVPAGIRIVVESSLGEEQDIGTVPG
jgi:uncharacterized hydrophobic protein (TIGR00271 family)